MNVTQQMRMLLACARWFAGTGSLDDVRSLADGNPDWAAVIGLARAHGLAPLAAWCIETAVREHLGADVMAELRAIVHANAAKNLFLTAELLAVLRLFEERQIAVVPFKGPVLAALMSDAVAWRESSDLDLLVRPEDITRAKDVLLANGYRLQSHLPGTQETAAFHWNSQIILAANNNGAHVDLHWRLLPGPFPGAGCFDSVWQRLQPRTFQDRTVDGLSDEDLLLFLCAHGAKHSWQSLALAVDVAGFIRARRELDWELLIRRSRLADGELVLALGLWMANRLLGAELPPPVLERVNAAMNGQAFARRVLERILVELPEDYATPSEFWLQIRLAGSWRAKLRYAAGYSLLPTEADGAALRLPPPLFFLYYPYRQARLAVKYGARLLRSGAANAAPDRN